MHARRRLETRGGGGKSASFLIACHSMYVSESQSFLLISVILLSYVREIGTQEAFLILPYQSDAVGSRQNDAPHALIISRSRELSVA